MRSYLPYHGLDTANFLEWWDILVWVEGSIYALDEDNEEHTFEQISDSERIRKEPQRSIVNRLEEGKVGGCNLGQSKSVAPIACC